jgi:hypothetical protein
MLRTRRLLLSGAPKELKLVSNMQESQLKMRSGKLCGLLSASFTCAWFAVFMSLFFGKASGAFSISATLVISSMIANFMLAGDAFLKGTIANRQGFDGIPLKFLIGALVSNIALCLTAFLLPFGLLVDWFVVIAITVIAWAAVRTKKGGVTIPACADGVDPIFACVSTIAVLIWCSDLMPPMTVAGNVVELRTWVDVYYHMGEIGSLARSTGLASMQDLQMAGAQVHPYHLASYFFPALLQHVTGVPSWTAFGGVLVPFGLLLTSCGAFSLARPTFGRWPALIAGLSILLIPDVYHQGFGNQFVGGYNWMQQVGPGGMYGVASAAVAFLFLFEACRTRNLRLVAVGYFFVVVTLMFKAQVFVAVSFPAFIFPALFFAGIRPGRRVALVLLLTLLYMGVIAVSQRSPNVPVMRLDGSGLKFYSSLILATQDEGVIKTFLSAVAATVNGSPILGGLLLALGLVVTTFGFVTPLYALAVWRNRKMDSAAVRLFPILIGIVYLIMSTCLSPDTRHFGEPEELLHRHFVWAYFVLLTWTTAGLSQWLLGDERSPSRPQRYAIAVVSACMLIVPIRESNAIATFKQLGVIRPRELPLCQMKAVDYLRTHSAPGDIIQDSLNDLHFIWTGLSGRQIFALDSGGVRSPAGVAPRLASLHAINSQQSPAEVENYMRTNKIAFFITNPGDSVAWRGVMGDRKVFQCGQYSIYRF